MIAPGLRFWGRRVSYGQVEQPVDPRAAVPPDGKVAVRLSPMQVHCVRALINDWLQKTRARDPDCFAILRALGEAR